MQRKKEDVDYILKLNRCYNEGLPLVCDNVYDDFLQAFDKKYGRKEYHQLISRISKMRRTRRVERQHPTRILEYKKTDKIEEIKQFCMNTDKIIVEPKFDGVFLNIIYIRGKAMHALLKGNGIYGGDVFNRISKSIAHIPELCFDKTEIYAEILRKKNMRNEDYTTARHEIIAYLMQISDAKDIDFDIIIHGIDPYSLSFYMQHYGWKEIDDLYRLFNKYNMQTAIIISSLDKSTINLELLKNIENNESLAHVRKLYDLDGLMFKNRQIPAILKHYTTGSANLGYYNYLIGYKFRTALFTTVKSVSYQTSKDGRLIPLIHIEPILVSNIRINRISGYNYRFIVSNNIGVGAKIKLTYKVIVLFDCTLQPAEVMRVENCATCNARVVEVENDLICPNIECSVKFIGSILNCLRILDIKDIGEAFLTKLYNESIYRRYPDLFAIDKRFDKLTAKGKEKIVKIRNAFSSMRDLLLLFSIRNIGKVNASLISKIYVDLESLSKDRMNNFALLRSYYPEHIFVASFCDFMNREFDLFVETFNACRAAQDCQKSKKSL